LKRIASHLRQPSTRIGNLWLLEHAGSRFLIDTGHALERPSLLAELMVQGGIHGPGDLTAILLTHRHGDHAGNAAWMRKRFGARVYCHENDAAALQGRSVPSAGADDRSREGARRRKRRLHERWLAAYEDRAPAFCEIDGVYAEGAWQWGFQVIPTPGHTEGSAMLYHEPTRTLFSGDALLVGPPWAGVIPGLPSGLPRLTDLPGVRSLRKLPWVGPIVAANETAASLDPKRLRLADAAFSQDAESCHRAVQRFLRGAPPLEFICPGHGPALDEAEGIPPRIARLLRELENGTD
jgi:glyoxylase-like metal-dependent hydrolase (beta-lactamase superfamily II)